MWHNLTFAKQLILSRLQRLCQICHIFSQKQFVVIHPQNPHIPFLNTDLSDLPDFLFAHIANISRISIIHIHSFLNTDLSDLTDLNQQGKSPCLLVPRQLVACQLVNLSTRLLFRIE